MGDDELNFAEEEPRYWADDPKNRATDCGGGLRSFVLGTVLVLAVVLAVWLVTVATRAPAPGQLPLRHLTQPAAYAGKPPWVGMVHAEALEGGRSDADRSHECHRGGSA